MTLQGRIGLGVAGLVAIGMVFSLPAIAKQGGVRKGANAPAFSASGTDGKTHTLATLTKDGPVFLYFIKIGCPVNHRAAPHVINIEKAYEEKGNVVGVINGSVADGKQWAARYGAKFPILADPDLKIIRSYNAPYSPFMIQVTKDGKIGTILEGLSPKELAAANTLIAESLKANAAAMQFPGAPSGGG